MKKSVVLTILGLGMAAATTTAFGQGGIVIGNYKAPFNSVIWGTGGTAPTGTDVLSTQGVSLSIWFGEGVLTADQLVLNVPTTWNIQAEGGGYAGYYGPTTVSLPGWSPGETWTFQIRASGNSTFGAVDTTTSRSAVWTESANIADIGGTPPGPPGVSSQSIGFAVNVPEPTTFALAGLGAASLMIFRRRNS